MGLTATVAIAQQAPAYSRTNDTTMDSSTASTTQQDLKPMWVDAAVNPREQSYFDAGLSASYGRDSAVNNIPNLSSQFSNLQGHIGIASVGRRFSSAFSHDATILQFPGSNLDLQQYHWTTVSLNGVASRRTTWGLTGANAYGADSARASSSLSLSSVSNTPIDNGTVQAGLISGNVLRQYVNFVVDHELSETRAFTFGANAGFHNFLGAAPSTQQYNVNMAVRQYFGPHVLAGIRGDGVRQNFGIGQCTTAAVTAFTTVQLTESLRADGSAGPVFGSAQCTGNYQYQGVLSAQSVRGSRVYIGTSRKRGNGAISGSLWETSGYGGVRLGNPRRFTVDVNSGYTSYHGGTLTAASSDVSGYFVSGEYRRRLSQYLEWDFTVRHFQRTVSSVDLARTVFFVTFTWSKQHGGAYGR